MTPLASHMVKLILLFTADGLWEKNNLESAWASVWRVMSCLHRICLQLPSTTLNYIQVLSSCHLSMFCSTNPYQPWGICAPQGGADHTPLIIINEVHAVRVRVGLQFSLNCSSTLHHLPDSNQITSTYQDRDRDIESRTGCPVPSTQSTATSIPSLLIQRGEHLG